MKKITNKRFGKLVATGTLKRTNGVTKRLCMCDCGKETWLQTARLTTGHTKSCGCFQSEFRKLPEGVATKNMILDDYKTGARKRGLVWDISNDEFDKLIFGKCNFCGVLPNTTRIARRNNGNLTYNGIDRLDNSMGYIKGNIVTCCKICNRAKSNMDLDAFLSWIDNLKRYNG